MFFGAGGGGRRTEYMMGNLHGGVTLPGNFLYHHVKKEDTYRAGKETVILKVIAVTKNPFYYYEIYSNYVTCWLYRNGFFVVKSPYVIYGILESRWEWRGTFSLLFAVLLLLWLLPFLVTHGTTDHRTLKTNMWNYLWKKWFNFQTHKHEEDRKWKPLLCVGFFLKTPGDG